MQNTSRMGMKRSRRCVWDVGRGMLGVGCGAWGGEGGWAKDVQRLVRLAVGRGISGRAALDDGACRAWYKR